MDNWLRELEECKGLVLELQQQVKQGGHNHEVVKSQNDELHLKLDMLEEDLNEMAKNPVTFRITNQEVDRRRSMLNPLAVKCSEIDKLCSRDQLLGAKSTKKVSRAWGETAETQDLQNQEMLQLHDSKMRSQDIQLEQLSGSISRQKNIARAIGDETELHLTMLEGMDDRLDRTTREVARGSNQVASLEDKSSTCFWWVMIAILAVIIVVLLFL